MCIETEEKMKEFSSNNNNTYEYNMLHIPNVLSFVVILYYYKKNSRKT